MSTTTGSDGYSLPRRVKLTYEQNEAMIEARISFMNFCPFFAYIFYDMIEEYYTDQVESLATDSKRIFINPMYFVSLKPTERAFALAHEMYHVVQKHPQRGMFYRKQGHIENVPFDQRLMNIAMDYPINADLVDNKVGTCNPAWLYDPKIRASEAFEDVYKRLYQPGVCPPPPGRKPGDQPGGGGQGQGQGQGQGNQPVPGSDDGQGELPKPITYGQTQRGGKPDQQAQDNAGSFDRVLDPYTDRATGKVDVPSDMEFKEAVVRASAAAKAVGNMPGSFKTLVDKILESEVNWRDYLRLKITGKLGLPRETWNTPNRRRIVLNPMIYLPGKTKYGADDVTVVGDSSGSMSDKEIAMIFAETGAIINDCKPRNVRLIWCDMIVQRVDEARTLDELAHIRVQGAPGRGGTDFCPPFAWLAERNIRPDTLIYVTDMEGGFPKDPGYPVIWCSTSKRGLKAPFGELVEINRK